MAELGAPTRSTEIRNGDIYFQDGDYYKRLNVKTASDAVTLGTTVVLSNYTAGTTWSDTVIMYAVVGWNFGSSIHPWALETNIVWSVADNEFHFTAKVNGVNISNSALKIMWFAREEVYDSEQIVITGNEATAQTQDFTTTIPSGATVTSVLANTGIATYSVRADNVTVDIQCRNGAAYNSYSIMYDKTTRYNYSASHPTYINPGAQYSATPFPGNYTGTVPLYSNTTIYGAYAWYGVESLYQDNTTSPVAVGSQIGSTWISGDYQYKWICTKSTLVGYSGYIALYDTFRRQQRRQLWKDIRYRGPLHLNTYLYIIYLRHVTS